MLPQRGEKIERLSFDLALVHLRGPAADDNDAQAGCRESLAGAGPHSHSHSCTGDIKGWPVEAPTGQTALAGWIVGLCEFISTIVGVFFPFPERNVSNVIVACLRVHIRVCEDQNIPLTK